MSVAAGIIIALIIIILIIIVLAVPLSFLYRILIIVILIVLGAVAWWIIANWGKKAGNAVDNAIDRVEGTTVIAGPEGAFLRTGNARYRTMSY